jgi:hypothetical protein
VVGVLDLAAARALEVALIERLELHQQRVALAAGELLASHVCADSNALSKRYRHGLVVLPDSRRELEVNVFLGDGAL